MLAEMGIFQTTSSGLQFYNFLLQKLFLALVRRELFCGFGDLPSGQVNGALTSGH